MSRVPATKRRACIVKSELQRLIDVGRRRNPFLQHVKRLIADHGVDAARDEPRRFFDHHSLFAHTLANFDGGCDRVVVGLKRADDF